MRPSRPLERASQIALALVLIGAPLAIAMSGSGIEGAASMDASQNPWLTRGGPLLKAMGRSFLIGGGAVLLALAPGIAAAWLLARTTRILPFALVALPLAMPPSVAVSGWIHLLAPSAASRFRMPQPEGVSFIREWLFSPLGATVVLASLLWPLIAFELYPAFRRVRWENHDAARILASPVRAFFRVTLPSCRGELLAGALMVFLFASGDFTVCSLLLVKSLPVEIHDALSLGKSAAAAWCALPWVGLVIAGSWAVSRRSAPRPIQITSSTPPRRSRPAVLICLAALAIGFVVPMAACLDGALAGGRSSSTVFGVGVDALSVSFRMAIVAVATTLSITLLRLVLWPEQRTSPLTVAALFLLAVPGSFLAAALLSGQAMLGPMLKGDRAAAELLPVAILGAGWTLRFLYLPLRLVDEGLAAIEPGVCEAAALLGHPPLSRTVSVVIPLLLPHLAAASALVFILCLGEVPVAVLLAPPGHVPATIWLFQQQHLGYDEQVFGLSLLMGALAVVALALAGGAAKIGVRLFRRRA